jgi:hypothetical protein
VKIELSFFLTRYHVKKTFGGVDVWLHNFLIPTLGGGEWYVSCPVASSPGKGFPSSLCRRKSGWPPGRVDSEENEKSVPLPGIEPRFHGIRSVAYPVDGEHVPGS